MYLLTFMFISKKNIFTYSLYSTVTSASTYLMSECTRRFRLYAVCNPLSWTWRHMACVRWNTQPLTTVSGNTCRNAFQTAASKSTMKPATFGSVGRQSRTLRRTFTLHISQRNWLAWYCNRRPSVCPSVSLSVTFMYRVRQKEVVP